MDVYFILLYYCTTKIVNAQTGNTLTHINDCSTYTQPANATAEMLMRYLISAQSQAYTVCF